MKFVRVALIAMLLLTCSSVSVFAQSAAPAAPPSDDPFVASASVAVATTEAGQLKRSQSSRQWIESKHAAIEQAFHQIQFRHLMA